MRPEQTRGLGCVQIGEGFQFGRPAEVKALPLVAEHGVKEIGLAGSFDPFGHDPVAQLTQKADRRAKE